MSGKNTMFCDVLNLRLVSSWGYSHTWRDRIKWCPGADLNHRHEDFQSLLYPWATGAHTFQNKHLHQFLLISTHGRLCLSIHDQSLDVCQCGPNVWHDVGTTDNYIMHCPTRTHTTCTSQCSYTMLIILSCKLRYPHMGHRGCIRYYSWCLPD